MMRWRGIVFDLDDTLYLERDYVRSGFSAVARSVASRVEISGEEILESLWSGFEAGVRGGAFDRLLIAKPEIGRVWSVSELVEIYRGHRPEIDWLPGMEGLLARLGEQGRSIGLVSDGWLESQRAKVRALGLDRLVPLRILTGAWGRRYWKPHPRAFREIMGAWSLPAGALIYVADNPDKDFLAPNELGWHTVRLRTPGQLHFDLEAASTPARARHEVEGTEDLERLLAG